MVVSRPKPEVEPGLDRVGEEGFDFDQLSADRLRRYLSLTEEAVVERFDEETFAERVEQVGDVADRFMADPATCPRAR